MCRAIIAATGIPFGTGRLPPWTKSAWRSTASKAFLIRPLASLDWPHGTRDTSGRGRCIRQVTPRKVAPFGSWASPVTVDLLLKGTVHMRNQMIRWDAEDLYWSELRPDEAGRIVVCRRDARGAITDVTPPGFNARTGGHEYGGGQIPGGAGPRWFPTLQKPPAAPPERGRGAGGRHP